MGNAGIGLAQTAGSFLSIPVGFTNQVAAGLAGAGRGFMADPRGFTNNIMDAAYASATTSEGIGGITFGALTAIAGGGLLKEIGTVGRVTRLTEKVDLPDAPSTSTQAAKVYLPDAPSTQAAKDASNVFSKEKQVLVDMAKADKRTGMTKADMDTYKELNKQLPDPFPANKVRGPEAHPSRSPHSQQPHGHVGPVDHIPITDVN